MQVTLNLTFANKRLARERGALADSSDLREVGRGRVQFLGSQT